MKVLMVNHPDCAVYSGGDMVQLRKTADALRALGVTVEVSTAPEPDAAGYDLVHVFNLRTADATLRQLRSLKRAGAPIIMTPFYCNMSFLMWALHCVQGIFYQPRPPQEALQMLDGLRQRALTVTLSNNVQLTAESRVRPTPQYDQTQAAALELVDHLLPNSYVEMDLLVKNLRVCHVPFTVAPSAVDAREYHGSSAEAFAAKYGVRDFVLQVSRLEIPKNQLMLVLALRDLDLPVVLVGKHLDASYVDLCRRNGPKRLTVLSYLPQEELPLAYAAARVHVLPSWVETCGMVSLEAALEDCNVVVSTTGCELEYFREYAYYCDPLDPQSIRGAVVRAYDNYDCDVPRRREFREVILREFSWERSARITLDVYERLLAARRTGVPSVPSVPSVP
jgi:glycosyltransferase involved in cell wall biosynthesis